MSTFLESVNRVLLISGVISGDDTELTSFSDTQHVETMNLAKIAIQSTLTYVIAEKLIPYEETEGEIVTVSGTRVYSLPADFVRFSGKNPFLLKLSGTGGTSENTIVMRYPGGENRLKRHILDYKDQSGTPNYWYDVDATTKKIGLYQVPDTTGVYYGFQYEKDISVTSEANTLPFHSTTEDYAFLDMAARYFYYLFSKQPIEQVFQDPIFKMGHQSLSQLMQTTYAVNKYGYSYQ